MLDKLAKQGDVMAHLCSYMLPRIGIRKEGIRENVDVFLRFFLNRNEVRRLVIYGMCDKCTELFFTLLNVSATHCSHHHGARIL